MTQIDYLWIIKDLGPRLYETADSLKSSIFNGGGDGKTTFRLIMYPKHFSTNLRNVDIRLELIAQNEFDFDVNISISIFNAKGDKVASYKSKELNNYRRSPIIARMSISRRKIFDSQGRLLHGDTLYVQCKLDSDLNVGGKSIISSLDATESLLNDGFQRLLENGTLSDVTLVVGENEFQAHKAVLAGRSPVFAAMFEHDMSETTSNRVLITDMDADVLREMLRYMYTNNEPSTEKLAKDILVAADKYGLLQLMRICEIIVGRGISIKTAAEMLLLADSHNAKHLKAHAIEYINSNATQVMDTDGWKNLVISHSFLIAETYGALITQMKQKVVTRDWNCL